MNPVTTSLGPNVHHGIANPRGIPFLLILLVHQPYAHGIDQQITLVARIKSRFTSDGWNSHAVAVVANPAHNAIDFHPRLGIA